MKGVIAYSSHKLDYRLRFSARRTLAITVHPNGAIEVVAPKGTAKTEIEERIRKRARWILRQRAHFDQFRPRATARRYVGGETHLYLGRQYRLKIAKGKRDEVKLKGGFLNVLSPRHCAPSCVKRLVSIWYTEKARSKLNERFNAIIARFKPSRPNAPSLRLRYMRRRWGSCHKAGRISLNPDLIRAPTLCIDYVITHELVHLAHPNHGAGFFQLLEALMPDWRHRKLMLEQALS